MIFEWQQHQPRRQAVAQAALMIFGLHGHYLLDQGNPALGCASGPHFLQYLSADFFWKVPGAVASHVAHLHGGEHGGFVLAPVLRQRGVEKLLRGLRRHDLVGIGGQYRISQTMDVQLDIEGIDKLSSRVSAGTVTMSVRKRF